MSEAQLTGNAQAYIPSYFTLIKSSIDTPHLTQTLR